MTSWTLYLNNKVCSLLSAKLSLGDTFRVRLVAAMRGGEDDVECV